MAQAGMLLCCVEVCNSHHRVILALWLLVVPMHTATGYTMLLLLLLLLLIVVATCSGTVPITLGSHCALLLSPPL
jgi:hypothetical protein